MKKILIATTFAISFITTSAFAIDVDQEELKRKQNLPVEELTVPEFCTVVSSLTYNAHQDIKRGIGKQEVKEFYNDPDSDWGQVKEVWGEAIITRAENSLHLSGDQVIDDAISQCYKVIYDNS